MVITTQIPRTKLLDNQVLQRTKKVGIKEAQDHTVQTLEFHVTCKMVQLEVFALRDGARVVVV